MLLGGEPPASEETLDPKSDSAPGRVSVGGWWSKMGSEDVVLELSQGQIGESTLAGQ